MIAFVKRVRNWLVWFGVVVGALIVAFVRGRSSGKSSMKTELNVGREKLKDDYAKIDNETDTPSAAYDRLKRMSDD